MTGGTSQSRLQAIAKFKSNHIYKKTILRMKISTFLWKVEYVNFQDEHICMISQIRPTRQR